MHTTMDGSPPSCSSTTAAVTPTGPCISPPTSTTDQLREVQGSPKQDSLCAKRPSTTKLKHSSRHMPYPEGSARSPGSCSSDGDSVHSDGEELARPVSKVKRIAANSRERKRMHTVNSAFDQLRDLVPTYPSNRKLSKIDTLRLACTYIQDLVSLLHNTAAVQGEDVLYHQPFPDGFNGYPVAVKAEMVDFPGYPAAEPFRMQPASCLRFASDCPETFTSSTSESDSCTHSPPQQPFMQCLPPSSIAVRPPPLTRTSSEGTSSIHTRMAEASISSTAVSSGASLPPLPPPISLPVSATPSQPTAASPSPVPSPPMYQRAPANLPSPLAMHSVQHTNVAPHLIHASLSHHSTTPVWNRPSSIPSPYPVYGQ